jgi:hypothetical protein
MNENQNPFFVILQAIEKQNTLIEKLIYNQQPVTLPDYNKYEQGVKVAMEELNWKEQTVYQNIDKLPKKKLHGKLYFNRAELQAYIRNEGVKK